MKKIKIDKCPYCDSTEFVKGTQFGYAAMLPQRGLLSLGSSIEHTICKECGSIVHSRVTKVERFK